MPAKAKVEIVEPVAVAASKSAPEEKPETEAAARGGEMNGDGLRKAPTLYTLPGEKPKDQN